MLEYKINAYSKVGGEAKSIVNNSVIQFDASANNDIDLPNPVELLLSSLAACILKNVERYSVILKYPYRSAQIQIKAFRPTTSPTIEKIEYLLEIETDIEEKHLKNWHKNILKFGTISNTISKGTKLEGHINFLKK